MISLVERYDNLTGSKISPDKSSLLSNSKSNLKIKYNNNEIQNKNSIKFLGCFLNLDLNWKEMEDFLEFKIKTILSNLNKKYYLDTNSIILFINQAVISILDYRFGNIIFREKFLDKINNLIINTISKNSKIWKNTNKFFYNKFRKLNNLKIQNIKNYLINFQRIISNNLPISKHLINKNYKIPNKKYRINQIYKYEATSGIPDIVDILNSLDLKIYKPKKIQMEQKFITPIEKNNKIQIFTDGSLRKSENENEIIKISAIYSKELIKINFVPICSNSSFGTELNAILAALLISINIKEVEIFSDSLSAIEAINNFKHKKISQIIKNEDRHLLKEINYLMEIKEIKPTFHHVFSHLDKKETKNQENKIQIMKERFNEKFEEIIENNLKVDELTNKDSNNYWILNKNDKFLDNLIFESKNNSEIILIPLKKLINEKLMEKIWETQINKNNKSNLIFKNINVDWEHSNLIFKEKNNSNLQNFVQKLWNFNLETKSKMYKIAKVTTNKEIKKNLMKKYTNYNCKFCGEYDNFNHFTTECKKTKETLNKSTIDIKKYLEDNFIDHQDIKWWFSNNETNKITNNNFDLKLGDIGLIPIQLKEFLIQNEVSNIKKILKNIQIIILKNLYNLWKDKTS